MVAVYPKESAIAFAMVHANPDRRPSAADVLASFEEYMPSSAPQTPNKTDLHYVDPLAEMLRISTKRNVELETENTLLRAELAAFKQAQAVTAAAVPATPKTHDVASDA